jgi:hypothetical protein
MHSASSVMTWSVSRAANIVGTRYTSPDGDWVELGDGVNLGDGVKLGNGVTLGDGVTLGNYVTLGNDVKLGNGVTLGETPLYLIPPGGQWHVAVVDPARCLVQIGCEVHPITYWLSGGADEVRERHNAHDTANVYDAAIRFVAQIMGWEAPGDSSRRSATTEIDETEIHHANLH